jgi:uncharacterized protein (DUF2249 family)
MELTPDTRLARVLDEIPGALEYVVGLNPHDFSRLRNGVTRKYMAPRISLGRIAAMVNMSEQQLLSELAALSGGTASLGAAEPTNSAVRPQSPTVPPRWLADAEAERLHQVNVLRIDDVLGDPLPPINAAIKRLEPGSVLTIHHRWEPQPLYDVWTKMGLEWFAEKAGPEEWLIFVHRPVGVRAPSNIVTSTIDLRHLPPTERAPRLIAMVEQLRPGEGLDAWAEATPWLTEVRAALDAAHDGTFDWQEAPGPDRLNVRVTRRAGDPGVR